MTHYVCYDKMLGRVTGYPRITDDEPIYNPDPELCVCLTVVEQAEPADREGYYKSVLWEVDLDTEEYRQVWSESEIVDLPVIGDGSGTGV